MINYWDNLDVNKAGQEEKKESLAEKSKNALGFIALQMGDIIRHLEKSVEVNYEKLEKEMGPERLEDEIRKETYLIETLYKLIEDKLPELKDIKLKNANKGYLDSLEGAGGDQNKKEFARQEYLDKLEKLVSPEDFEKVNKKISAGNFFDIERYLGKLAPGESVMAERVKQVSGKTREESIGKVKEIYENLKFRIEQGGDITDYGLYSVAAACEVLSDLIKMYKFKIEIYKSKVKSRQEE